MQLATAQFEPRDSVAANREVAENRIRMAADAGADLVILPEIWNVGYFNFDRYESDAEPITGETIGLIRDLAAELDIAIHAGSIVERDGDNLYNTSVFVDRQGNIRDTYRKMHLFGYESAENDLLTSGDNIVCFDTEFGRVGMATCYDLRFPGLFRAISDQNVDLLLIASAWPLARLEHWLMLTRVRAFEHQVFLAAANLVGTNCGTQLGGNSCIVDPWGTILANAGERERTVHATIDHNDLDHARDEFPVLADRRLTLEYRIKGE